MLDMSVLGGAMGTLDAMTDVLLGSKTFDLKVISWRRFLHGVSRSANRQFPDDHRIELQCRFHQSLLEGAVIVGENPTQEESLGDIEFSLELRSAQKVFSDFEGNDLNPDEGGDAVGILMYNAPISSDSLAGLPSSVIEKSKTGSVNGWIFYGDNSLIEISRLLMVEPKSDIHIWVTVKAASSATPSSLIYERKLYHPTNYRWDAKNNPLEVTEARVVVTSTPAPTQDVTTPELMSLVSTVSEAMVNSVRSLDTKVGRVGLTIVVLLAALLIELWRRF